MTPVATRAARRLVRRRKTRNNNPAVAAVSGDLDIATAPWLRETLLLAIQWCGPAIAVDLQGVTFLDCAGVNALLAAAHRARLAGGRVRVTRSSAPAWRVITLLGLQELFTGADNPGVLQAGDSVGCHRRHQPFGIDLDGNRAAG